MLAHLEAFFVVFWCDLLSRRDLRRIFLARFADAQLRPCGSQSALLKYRSICLSQHQPQTFVFSRSSQCCPSPFSSTRAYMATPFPKLTFCSMSGLSSTPETGRRAKPARNSKQLVSLASTASFGQNKAALPTLKHNTQYFASSLISQSH